MLDLAGYTTDRALSGLRLLEPSFGRGSFLLMAVQRLLDARDTKLSVQALHKAIRAVEVHCDTFEQTRHDVLQLLLGRGLSMSRATEVVDAWLTQDDFLLARIEKDFDIIVGNPPYLRQEAIAAPLLRAYRARYVTLFDRADLYVPFFEQSLDSLANGGRLVFICSDRWMKNRYGGPLRRKITEGFFLRSYVDMGAVKPFTTDVVAYPAITVMAREKPGITLAAHSPQITRASLTELADKLSNYDAKTTSLHSQQAKRGVTAVAPLVSGDRSWAFDNADQVALVRRWEELYTPLEEVGCRVGIGVATGADSAFIGPFDSLDVETERKVPLAMTHDIRNGGLAWRGFGVINPFESDGRLVELARYPRLSAYLAARKDVIANRFVAKKTPSAWFRTIDKIDAHLASRRKLLIPDIKGSAGVVVENGKLYPHHNLYYVTSQAWNLFALRAFMLSSACELFIRVYSIKMRGGYLRYQAQYLRRICIPAWENLSQSVRCRLEAAGRSGELQQCDDAAATMYGLSVAERSAVQAMRTR